MKRILLIGGPVAASIAAVVVLVAINLRSQRPEVLVDRLLYGDENALEETAMRLNLARGDVVGAMVGGLGRNQAPAPRRAMLLELMFKKNDRARDEKLERAMLAAAKDPDPAIRLKTAWGIAVYGGVQAALPDLAADTDLNTRRQAYMVLCAPSWEWRSDIWKDMDPREKDKLIERAGKAMETEKDDEMRLLARSVIGREIATRCEEATQAVQASELDKAEKTFKGALELDGGNQQAQVRLVRFYLKNEQKEEALAIGRKYGAIIEVPQLSEAPVIDGDPTDEAWRGAFEANEFYVTTSPWAPQHARGKTKAHIGHKDGKIYVAILGYEKELHKLERKLSGRDSDVYRDDCVELIFDPAVTGKDIYQIVINSRDAVFDHFNNDKEKNFEFEHKTAIFNDRGYWACEFAMKGEALGNFRVAPGTIWAMNLFRARIGPDSEHCAMWPTFGGALRSDLYPIVVFK